MKANAREILSKFGSKKAKNLGWRDMWAMVAKKIDHDLKRKGGVKEEEAVEDYSRSTEFHSWGAPVFIKAVIQLTSPQGNIFCSLVLS